LVKGGPGARKLVVGRLRLATTARARARPGFDEFEDVELECLLELPHAAASTATPARTAVVVTAHLRPDVTRCLVMYR
jgi:hypothetical protein